MDSQQPILGLKGMVLQNEGKSYTNGALAWNQNKVQIKRESGRGGLVGKSKRSPGRVLKKRAGPPTRRRRDGSIRRRVKTLKRLVPSSGYSTGLDGLFRETADYILSLQSRVRLMQVMVHALAGSDDQE